MFIHNDRKWKNHFTLKYTFSILIRHVVLHCKTLRDRLRAYLFFWILFSKSLNCKVIMIICYFDCTLTYCKILFGNCLCNFFLASVHQT